jgi:hypothetical protein
VRNHLVRLLTWRCGSSSKIRGRRPRITFPAGWKRARVRGAPASGSAASRASVRIRTLARPAKAPILYSCGCLLAVLVGQGEMAGVHKNTKGLRCPSFRSLTKSLDTCLGSRHGTSRSRILQSRRLRAPVHRNRATAVRVSVLVADKPGSWEVVFKTERQKTPPVEILFLNMLSAAIVGETRKSL